MTTTRTVPESPAAKPAWAGRATDYDRWFDEPWGRYAFAVESAAVINASGPLEGRRVLDAGCGTGRFGGALARQSAGVVGLEPDPNMIGLARTRLVGRCVEGVAERLPFADCTFDVTVAITVLEFVTDPAAAVAEMARVTRPSGRIVIGALNPHSPWGLANRSRLRSGTWCDARFLDRPSLAALGEAHGRVVLTAALYAPGALPGIAVLGATLDAVGSRAAPAWGAFQVLAIDTAAG